MDITCDIGNFLVVAAGQQCIFIKSHIKNTYSNLIAANINKYNDIYLIKLIQINLGKK